MNLGDIHFREENDWAADKGQIVAGVLSMSHDIIEQTILVVNGDLTFSGGKSQFAVAQKFLNELSDAFHSVTNKQLRIICTPGNHDCDFSNDQSARNQLLTKLKPTLPAKSIEAVVLEPLANYMEFVKACDFDGSINSSNPYKTEIRIEAVSGTIDIALLNSSWMSSRQESPGSILFPKECFTRHTEGVTRIVAMHHPPNWFKQPETMRDLIRWVTENADICMSGHEHSLDSQLKLNERFRGVMYYEGGVFQEHSEDSSGQFQVLDICTESGELVYRKYAWKDDHFALPEAESRLNYRNITAKASKTRLSQRFAEELDDPNIPGGGSRSPARLKDFFVYPDAVEYDEQHESNPRGGERLKVLGNHLGEYLLSRKSVLFLGPERCGKTSLAKQFVVDLHARGKMPVLFNAKPLAKALTEKRSIESIIRRELKRQYEDVSLEYFAQKCRDDAVAIVDDFEDVFEERATPIAVSTALREFFAQQALIASDEFAVLETQGELTNNVGLPTFKRLQLLDLGHEKVNELTSRWLNSAESQDRAESIAAKELAKLIVQILATDFIPHHPWIVIVLLETSVKDDVQAMGNGSYGHLYHAILTSAMAMEKRSGLDLNGKFNYLSYLAYEMYQRQTASMSDAESRDFHRQYTELLDRDISYERVIEGLIEARILKSDVNGVSFDARFSYCYFLASYFKLKMNEAEVKDAVKAIVDTLYHRGSANILLFLSHLAPGAWPLDLILDRASELFKGKPLWRLDSDMAPVLAIGDNALPDAPAFPVGTANDNHSAEMELDDDRRREIQTRSDFDGRSVEILNNDCNFDECDELIREVRSAYKLIRIMGQVLKNNVDSMEGPIKKKIVKSVFELSRRMLGDAFQDIEKDFQDRRESVLKHIEMLYEESGKRGDRQAMIVKADREVIGVSYLACFAVTRNVCDAVGARGLGKTYTRVVEDDKSLPNKLYLACLLMDNDPTFPTKELVDLSRDMRSNWFGKQLLQALVAWHFYMFERPIQLRQEVFQRLEIGTARAQDPAQNRMKPPRLSNDGRGRKHQ